MERHLAVPAEMERARGMEQPGDLGQRVAPPDGSNRGELGANVVGEHSLASLEREQPTLVLDAEGAVAPEPGRGDDPVAR